MSVVPMAAVFAQEPFGLRSMNVDSRLRRAFHAHTPARLEFRVRVPEGGRLDAALGVLRADVPVEFRVVVRHGNGEATTLLREAFADSRHWTERSVDLSRFAGQTLTLALEADAKSPGTVALWGSPTLSGARRGDKPNVIFYVIDGGWAEDMSVYGYNRRTTPNLERLAAEGAVFEHAYSNASSTRFSTPSFMTSLQSGALGNTRRFAPIPAQVLTMAERFHRAGYPTAVFTSNPNAGSPSSLDRGVDLMRDTVVRRDYTSSVELRDTYWAWRDAFPAQPYWVHFQTTDVHEYEGGPLTPVAPFSGMYVTAGRRREFYQEWERFNRKRGTVSATQSFMSGGLEAAGVDRLGFFETMRALYDESMAHQDYLGRVTVDRATTGRTRGTPAVAAPAL